MTVLLKSFSDCYMCQSPHLRSRRYSLKRRFVRNMKNTRFLSLKIPATSRECPSWDVEVQREAECLRFDSEFYLQKKGARGIKKGVPKTRMKVLQVGGIAIIMRWGKKKLFWRWTWTPRLLTDQRWTLICHVTDARHTTHLQIITTSSTPAIRCTLAAIRIHKNLCARNLR